jgi:hypothetical protein
MRCPVSIIKVDTFLTKLDRASRILTVTQRFIFKIPLLLGLTALNTHRSLLRTNKYPKWSHVLDGGRGKQFLREKCSTL